LEQAFQFPPRDGLLRQIVLFTDGEVGNEAECIDLVARHAEQCRVFTFGIGRGVSEHLVRGLARAGGGAAELIHPGERLEPKVLRQFARLASGAIRNVRMDWGKLRPDLTAPSRLGFLSAGDRLTVYARMPRGSSGDVSLLADGPGGALRFPIQVSRGRPVANRAVLVLMARKAIQELEEGTSARRGSAQKERKKDRIQQRILELALRYQIMSSATSFVAIEERAESSQTAPAELRRIPVALTRGWGGLDLRGAVPMCAPTTRAAIAQPVFDVARRMRSIPFVSFQRAAFLAEPNDAREESVPLTGGPASDPLIELTLQQQADGGYILTDKLVEFSGIRLAEFQAAARKLEIDAELAERVLATLVALQLLSHRFADRSDEWRLLADKARRWLARQNVPSPVPSVDLAAWAADTLNLR
jgi:Ca-activated chloride channel family protein